jgi:Bacterial Type VI secretion, VC_A0110, EvfL, ImpJ, VasE/TIR domain/FHA domain
MMLVLEVVGSHAASMGPNARRVLCEGELTIGSGPDNDWILSDPLVSPHQAVVRWVGGVYFVEQLGSCPVSVNEMGRQLGINRTVPLSPGDRILIRDFDIRVTEGETQLMQPARAIVVPYGDVVAIPVEMRRPHYYVGRIDDASLIDWGQFVLAAKASMPPDEIRLVIRNSVTVAPVAVLMDLVNQLTPGLTLTALAQAPSPIPSREDCVYFEIDRSSPLWKYMKNSGAYGLYVRGDCPSIAFSIWVKRIDPSVDRSTRPVDPAESLGTNRTFPSSLVPDPPPIAEPTPHIDLGLPSEDMGNEPDVEPFEALLQKEIRPKSASVDDLNSEMRNARLQAKLMLTSTSLGPRGAPSPAVTDRAGQVVGPGGRETGERNAASPQLSAARQASGAATPGDAFAIPGAAPPMREIVAGDLTQRKVASDRVQMTVFGPERVARRQRLFLQAVLHPFGAEGAAREVAEIAEKRSAVAQVLPLPGQVRIGATVTVRIRSDPRVAIDEPEQTLHWTGDIVAKQFAIQLPWVDWRRDYLFIVEVDVDGCPLGSCKFRLSVANKGVIDGVPRACGELHRYRHAFLSYASEDRSIVADMAQLLEIQGIDYFLDQVSLRSGSIWRRELEKNIENADLFLLCWSRYAAESEWVQKEIDWALRTQRRTGGLRPEIRPFILGGPPIPRPPKSLRHLHFSSAAVLLKRRAEASSGN